MNNVFLAAACVMLAANLIAAQLNGRVVGVADGDTITVLDATKTQHKIRLNTIDAPEKAQAFGQKGKQRLSDYVFGKDVNVEWRKKDRYGRILGTVWHGSMNVNLQMIKDGFAWHYKQYDQSKVYADAEDEARAAKRGLWVDKSPTPPWEFRKAKRNKQK